MSVSSFELVCVVYSTSNGVYSFKWVHVFKCGCIFVSASMKVYVNTSNSIFLCLFVCSMGECVCVHS